MSAALRVKLKEKPILFSGPMIRAILEGRKTQTRRVITDERIKAFAPGYADDRERIIGMCPYGKIGDRLLCYNCFYGQTDSVETDSGIAKRRLQGGIGRADLQSHAVCGVRAQGTGGLVPAEGTNTEGKRLRDGYALPREQTRHQVGSSSGVHGLSRNAAERQAGDAPQGRQQREQQAHESLLGHATRKLAGQAGARNGNGGRETLGSEVHERGTKAYSLGGSEGALQSEASGTCAQCQLVVDKRYRCGGTGLWVRESFYAYGHYQYTGNLTETGKREIEFVDLTLRSNRQYQYAVDIVLPQQSNKFDVGWHKRPSIFMPRWASRITLEITNIRVERLQETSEADAIAEGIQRSERTDMYPSPEGNCDHAVWAFKYGWDSLNAKRGYSWESNPLVWVIEFRKL